MPGDQLCERYWVIGKKLNKIWMIITVKQNRTQMCLNTEFHTDAVCFPSKHMNWSNYQIVANNLYPLLATSIDELDESLNISHSLSHSNKPLTAMGSTLIKLQAMNKHQRLSYVQGKCYHEPTALKQNLFSANGMDINPTKAKDKKSPIKPSTKAKDKESPTKPFTKAKDKDFDRLMNDLQQKVQ